jgi:hypothetical protein
MEELQKGSFITDSAKLRAIYDKIAPVCLAAVIMNAFLYVYTEEYVTVWGIVSAVYMAVCYAVFGEFKKKKAFGGFLYAVMLFFVVNAGGFIVFTGPQFGYRFIVWFFSGTTFEPTQPSYLIAFVLVFSFVFISVVFYFTEAVYRKLWLLVVSLIPFTAYAKMMMTPPIAYIILIAAFQLFIYLQKTRGTMRQTALIAGRKSVFTVYGDFAIALVLLIAIIPKPSVTPYWDEFEKALGRFTFGQFGSDEVGSVRNRSGNADDMNRGERRLLYNVVATEHNYLKMQSFPYYDPDGDDWFLSGDPQANPDWREDNSSFNITDFAAAVMEADSFDPGLLAGYGLEGDRAWFDSAANGADGSINPDGTANGTAGTSPDPVYEMYIAPTNYMSVFALAPNRPLSFSGTTDIYQLPGGGLAGLEPLPTDSGYNVEFYSDLSPIKSGYLDTAAANLSYEQFGDFLLDTLEKLPTGSKNRDIITSFYREHVAAMDWADYNTYRSETLSALADEITIGSDTVYGKAHAIEQYFFNSDFEYLLGYNAPVDTTEYFVFESKMGTCSDFATAFALLAGMEGLSVRYTEGYIPRVLTNEVRAELSAGLPGVPADQLYYITTEDAHAYPEVYINGFWVRFEPTVSALTGAGDGGGGAAQIDTTVVVVWVVVVLFMMAMAVLFIILLPVIRETGFRLSVAVSRGGNKSVLIMLYSRLLLLTGRKVSTPTELCDYIAIKNGFDTAPITEPLEAAVFGDIDIPKDTIKKAKQTYKAFYKKRKSKRDMK